MQNLKLGSRGDDVRTLKRILNKVGYKLDENNSNFLTLTESAVKAFQSSHGLKPDGEVGPKTWSVLLGIDSQQQSGYPPPAWYTAAKKYEGVKESESWFAAIMVPLWSKLFGRNLNSIQKYAWCGLGMAAALSWAGADWQKGGEMARAWGSYGNKIEWQKNGTPQGAIVWINNKGDCKSSASNHVAQTNGRCTAADLTKKGASIALYGANQSNAWKVSTYSASKICGVRYPERIKDPKSGEWVVVPIPEPVLKSVNCAGATSNDGESTR